MLGAISLIFFILIMVASVRKWVRQDVLPLQSLLVIGSLILVGLSFLFNHSFDHSRFFAATSLHPITATIAGFMLAGAVESAGGFAAASQLLIRCSQGFLGLSGTVLLLVNVPSIFAMPCGRVWAAALIPAALMFGVELVKECGNPALMPAVVFSLIVNAAASCGPSPLGGIGMIAEGTGGFDLHSFSNPQQLSIMVMTVLVMVAMVKIVKLDVNICGLAQQLKARTFLPESAYFSFFLYVFGLAAVFIVEPPVPIQTLLLLLTALVMLVGQVSFRRLLSGLIIHPVTAMVAGFMMAGALLVTGGFDSLTALLNWFAVHTWLGYIGVAVLLVYIPLIFPLPCGRIAAAALLPGVMMFGQQVSLITGVEQCLPAMMVAFILACAASCAPSPLGGIGGIGEGNLRLKSGLAGRGLQLSILLSLPISALIVSGLGLSTEMFRFAEWILAASLGMVSGVVVNVIVGQRFYRPGGIFSGLVVAALMMVL